MANEIELTNIIVMCLLIMMCAYQSLLASQFSAMRALDRYYCDAIDMVLVFWKGEQEEREHLKLTSIKVTEKDQDFGCHYSRLVLGSQSIYD